MLLIVKVPTAWRFEMVLYCECESPVMDIEHDAGCRRCGLPVNFSYQDRFRDAHMLPRAGERQDEYIDRTGWVVDADEWRKLQTPEIRVAAMREP